MLPRFASSGIALVVGVLSVSSIVAAGEGRSLTLVDGASVAAEAGRLVLVTDGKRSRTKPVKGADPKGAVLLLETHRLAGEQEAIHARFPAKGGGVIGAVAVRRAGQAKLKLIWQGRTGLEGELGERLGFEVRFEDLTGDGAPEIIVGQIYEAVRLCGAERLPLLYRKVYDPASGKLRPVLAKRPGLKEAVDVNESEGDGPSSSILGAASPASASRTAGDRGDPLLLVPPGALADGDPATAWFPGNGAGGGEFATFSLVTSDYGVTRLGLRAVPAGGKPGRYDRPRSVLLATEDGVYRLTFDSDPKTRPDDLVWFELPRPVGTSCLSLVVEQTFDPRGGKQLALTELVVLTEVDSPEGIERLAADMDHAERGEQAAMLLRRAGPRAVEPIRGAWPKLGHAGRRRAVRVLAEAAPEEANDLLAAAVVGGDEVSAAAALAGLERAGDAGVGALAKYLGSDDDSEFEAAAVVLGRLERDAALDALIAATGSGGRERRRMLRVQLGKSAVRSPKRQERLWTAIEEADSSGGTEQALDLMRAATGLPAIADRLVELAGARFAGAESFADRYRLLEVLAGSGDPRAREHLLAGLKDEDRKIRAVAIVGAGFQQGWSEAVALLRKALADEAVEVRLAALGAVVVAGLVEDAAPTLRELIADDPWPEVRSRVVTLAVRLPTEHAVALLRAAAVDESLTVRLTAMEAAVGVGDAGADAVVEGRLTDEEEQPEVVAGAARAAGRRCQVSAVPLLYEVLRKGAEPLAHAEDIEAAVAAARAMGRIGGERAGELLEKARRRSNPATDKAIDAALEHLGERCGAAPEQPGPETKTD
jgi:HEAT repeat protein